MLKPILMLNKMKILTKKNPKFKIGDPARTLKCKKIFAKEYTPNWSGEVFVICKNKKTVPSTFVINDLNSEEIVRIFYEKELP